MAERPYRHLSGEELRKRLKRADAAFSQHIGRLYVADPGFKAALDLTLALEDERDARKGNGNGAE